MKLLNNFPTQRAIKQPRKNKVFDYKSLIYETELKVLIMFQRDKHLQPETESIPPG